MPFAKLFHERLGIPVALTNDAKAAALGEMTYGVAKGMKNFIMLTLGTGLAAVSWSMANWFMDATALRANWGT